MTEGGTNAEQLQETLTFLAVSLPFMSFSYVVIKGGNVEREEIKDEIMKFHAIFITFSTFFHATHDNNHCIMFFLSFSSLLPTHDRNSFDVHPHSSS
jgi:hypothetical protein